MVEIKGKRINGLWVTLLGCSMLAASLFFYSILMKSVAGPLTMQELYHMVVAGTAQKKVALLRSDYTRRSHMLLSANLDQAAWVDATMLSWRKYLEDHNIPFDEIDDTAVERGELERFDTVILPSTRAMSDRQIEQLKTFMDDGGSVLATWTPGIFRPDGSWRGWTFVEEAFGVAFVDFAERNESGYQIYQGTFPGVVQPGLYVRNSPDASLNEVPSVAQADFAPLRDYHWADTLGAEPPPGDYVEAQPLMRQGTVVVTYYTWVGAAPDRQVPYPLTSTNVRRFTLRSDTPLTAAIPSGYRVKIQIYNPGVLMQVVDPRTVAAGFWYDFAVEDRPVDEALLSTTGIVYGTYGDGRFVYLGFPRDAMGFGPDDEEDAHVLGQLFVNIFNYLRRKPVAWMHNWPEPYQAGAILIGLGEEELDNLGGVMDMLIAHDVPGSFFVQPEGAATQRELIRYLSGRGEVGLLESEAMTLAGPQRLGARVERLAEDKRLLEEIIGKPVVGYRSRESGRLGRMTGEALVRAGFHYFVPDSIGRRIGPKLVAYDAGKMIRLGVTAHSDRYAYRWLHPDSIHLGSAVFKDDIARVQYEGGMYRFTYSSDLLGRPQYREALEDIVQEVKAYDFWVASAADMARWWDERQAVYVDVAERNASRIVVRISNTGRTAAHQLGVTVDLGRRVASVAIRPELIHTPIPAYTLDTSTMRLHLVTEHLKARENRVFHIDLLDEATPPSLTQVQ